MLNFLFNFVPHNITFLLVNPIFFLDRDTSFCFVNYLPILIDQNHSHKKGLISFGFSSESQIKICSVNPISSQFVLFLCIEHVIIGLNYLIKMWKFTMNNIVPHTFILANLFLNRNTSFYFINVLFRFIFLHSFSTSHCVGGFQEIS